MDLDPLLSEHGAWLVYVGTTISGDAVALAAGVLEQRGTLRFWPTLAAVTAAAFTSDVGIFLIGRWFSRSRRVGRALDEPWAQRLTDRLITHPRLLAAGTRFVPGSRTFVPLALATSGRIALPTFAAISALTSIVWAYMMIAIGHNLGELIVAIWGRIRETETILTLPALAILVTVATILWRFLRQRRKSRRESGKTCPDAPELERDA